MNTDLAERAAKFCKDVGYRGIFDMDWRRDPRTETYKLLDFNPRIGAQFRMFENDAGIDVARAMHLDMSGRPIPTDRRSSASGSSSSPGSLPTGWRTGKRLGRRWVGPAGRD